MPIRDGDEPVDLSEAADIVLHVLKTPQEVPYVLVAGPLWAWLDMLFRDDGFRAKTRNTLRASLSTLADKRSPEQRWVLTIAQAAGIIQPSRPVRWHFHEISFTTDGFSLGDLPVAVQGWTGYLLPQRSAPRRKLEWETQALLMLRDNPTLTRSAIARAVGRDKATVSRSQVVKQAIQAVKVTRPPGVMTQGVDGIAQPDGVSGDEEALVKFRAEQARRRHR